MGGMDGMDFNVKAYKQSNREWESGQERDKQKEEEEEKMNMVNSAHNHDL